jgi:hypothetical protein
MASLATLLAWVPQTRMAELIYPTSAELEGPWVISGTQLEALDEVVDEQAKYLLPSAQAQRRREIELITGEKAEWQEAERTSLVAGGQHSTSRRKDYFVT